MLHLLTQCWLAFVLSGLVSASNDFSDHTNSGNYGMVFCGAGEPNSKAQQLQTMLPFVAGALRRVVGDARMGTSSPHGFKAFFKTNYNRPAVLKTLQSMIDGAPVPIDSNDPFHGGATTALPTFVCLNDGNPNTITLWNACRARPLARAMHTTGDSWIILCPAFWELGGIPTSAMCPNVVYNKFAPDEHRLVVNQYGAIVRLLATMYIGGLNSGNPVPAMQDMVNLHAAQSITSEASYGYYAAGRLHSTVAKDFVADADKLTAF